MRARTFPFVALVPAVWLAACSSPDVVDKRDAYAQVPDSSDGDGGTGDLAQALKQLREAVEAKELLEIQFASARADSAKLAAMAALTAAESKKAVAQLDALLADKIKAHARELTRIRRASSTFQARARKARAEADDAIAQLRAAESREKTDKKLIEKNRARIDRLTAQLAEAIRRQAESEAAFEASRVIALAREAELEAERNEAQRRATIAADELRAANQRHGGEVGALRGEAALAQRLAADRQAQLDEALHTLQAHDDARRRLESELAATRRQAVERESRLQEELTAAQRDSAERIARLESGLRAASAESEERQGQLRDQLAEAQRLWGEREERLQAVLRDARQQGAEGQAKLQAELRAAQMKFEQHAESQEAEIVAARRLVDEWQQAARREAGLHRDNLQRIQAELTAAREQVTKFGDEAVARRTEFASLQAQLLKASRAAEDGNAAAHREKERLLAEIRAAGDNLRDAQQRLLVARHAAETAGADVLRLQRANRELEDRSLEATRGHDASLQAAARAHETALQAAVRDHEAMVQAMAEKHEASVRAMTDRHEARVQALADDRERAIADNVAKIERMQSSLARAGTQIAVLAAQIADRDAQIELLTAKAAEARALAQAGEVGARERLEQAMRELSSARARLADHERRLAQLSADADVNERLLVEKTAELARLAATESQTVRELTEEQARLRFALVSKDQDGQKRELDQAAELKRLAQQQQKDTERLVQQLRDEQAVVADLRSTIAGQQSGIAALRRELAVASESASETGRATAADRGALEARLREADVALAHVRRELVVAQEYASRTSAQLAEQARELGEQTAKLSEQSRKLAQQSLELDESVIENARLTEDQRRKEEQIVSLATHVTAQLNEVDLVTRALENQQATWAALQAKLTQREADIARLTTALREQRAAASSGNEKAVAREQDLGRQLSASTRAQATLRDELEATNRKLSAATRTLKEQSEETTRLGEELRRLAGVDAELNTSKRNLDAALAEATARIEREMALQKQVEELAKRLIATETELVGVNGKRRTEQENAHALAERQRDTEARLKKAEALLEAAGGEASRARREFDQRVELLGAELILARTKATEAADAASIAVQDENAKVQALEKTVADLELANAQKADSLRQLEDANGRTKAELALARRQLAEATSRGRGDELHIRELAERVAELENENAGQSRALAQLERNYHRAVDELKRLRSQEEERAASTRRQADQVRVLADEVDSPAIPRTPRGADVAAAEEPAGTLAIPYGLGEAGREELLRLINGTVELRDALREARSDRDLELNETVTSASFAGESFVGLEADSYTFTLQDFHEVVVYRLGNGRWNAVLRSGSGANGAVFENVMNPTGVPKGEFLRSLAAIVKRSA